MAESPPCVGDAESKGPLSPGLFSFSRGGTVSMPASYCTSMIESHLLVGTVTELNLHSCSFSLHVVSDSGLVPRTGSPPFGPQSSLLISVYAFLVTGLLSSWLQQGESLGSPAQGQDLGGAPWGRQTSCHSGQRDRAERGAAGHGGRL